MERLFKDRAAKMAALKDTHKQLVTEIRKVKTDIIAVLDQLEQQSLNEVKEFKDNLDHIFKYEMQLIDKAKTELQEILTKLGKTDKDDALMFSRVKQSQEMAKAMKVLVTDLQATKPQDKARFTADTQLERYVKTLKGLGDVVIGTPDRHPGRGGAEDSKRALDHNRRKPSDAPDRNPRNVSKSAKDQTRGKPSIQVNRAYRVSKISNINAKGYGDLKTCCIYGMCQLPDGSIVVTDYNNRKLKKLDHTYNVINQCYTSRAPFDVCATESGEVAVASWGNLIEFVTVGDEMATIRAFSTKHECYSLTYLYLLLYVVASNDNTVYVYNRFGSVLRAIGTDQHGRKMFSQVLHIAMDPRSNCLLVADGVNGLITMDTKGTFLSTCKPPELKTGFFAVCMDKVGNIFVREWRTDNVLQVGLDENRVLARILSKSDGIPPCHLCMDNVNNRLIVSNSGINGSDTISVLHLIQ